MPREFKINADHPEEVALGQRIAAQVKLAELLGRIDPEAEDPQALTDWLDESGDTFVAMTNADPGLISRILGNQLTSEDMLIIRDQMGRYDTGAERHDEEVPPLDA
jgi:hypothetical protein